MLRSWFSLAFTALALAFPFADEAPEGAVAAATTYAAVYFLLNNPTGNSIVSSLLLPNGSLYNPTTHPTWGNGAIGDTTTGPAMTDTLFSSNSIIVSHGMLFVVNAGSNTISSFQIDSQNPQLLTQIGNATASAGGFPNSLAYSHSLNLLCCANSGSTSGVACFNVYKTGLQRNTTLLIPGVVNQTNPPVGPQYTTSSVGFASDSSYLALTVKGNANPEVDGKIYIFPWNDSKNTFSKAVSSTTTGVALPFGFYFVNTTYLWVANAAGGAAFISVNPTTFKATTSTIQVVNGVLTCWVNGIRANTLYLMSATENNFYEFNGAGQLQRTIANGYGSNIGTYDNIIYNNTLYALTGTTGLAVVNLTTNTPVQQFSTKAVAPNRTYYEGMAFFSYATSSGSS